MRCWGVAVVLAVFFAFAGQAAAAGAGVSTGAVPTIAISGNRHVGADMIRSYFHPAPDGRLGATELDAALKRLYATGLFKDVKILRAGSRVLVTVVENQTIGVISFEGNKKIKDADLTKAVQSKVNGPLSRETVQSDVVNILALYRQHGYYDVHVSPEDDRRPKRRQQGYATPRKDRPRQSRLRDQRRRQARGTANPLRRQHGVFDHEAQGRGQDRHDQCVELSARQRHL